MDRLYSVHNRVFNVIGMAGGAVIAAAVAVLTGAWPVRLVAGLIAVGLLAWAVRGGLVGVRWDDDEVVIRELSRTRRVPWRDVVDVRLRTDRRFKVTVPELRVHTDETRRGGGRVAAMALASKREETTKAHVDTLAEQWHAHVADSSG